MYINAAVMFNIALKAYEKTGLIHLAENPLKQDAIVAIIMSVVSLETFINEVAELAAHPHPVGPRGPYPVPANVANLAFVLEDLVHKRESIKLKFQLAKILLSGESYAKGEQPYQDFALLIELRNAIIHQRPLDVFRFDPDRRGVVTTPPDILEKLRSKDILYAETQTTWINQVMTSAAARWACNAAANMVHSITNIVPESSLKESVDLFYQHTFHTVD
jgi:hypothetical protein